MFGLYFFISGAQDHNVTTLTYLICGAAHERRLGSRPDQGHNAHSPAPRWVCFEFFLKFTPTVSSSLHLHRPSPPPPLSSSTFSTLLLASPYIPTMDSPLECPPPCVVRFPLKALRFRTFLAHFGCGII